MKFYKQGRKYGAHALAVTAAVVLAAPTFAQAVIALPTELNPAAVVTSTLTTGAGALLAVVGAVFVVTLIIALLKMPRKVARGGR